MWPGVYIDFNTMMADEEARVIIGSEDSPQDRRDLFASLLEGVRVTIYDEELEVEAVVEVVQSSWGEKFWLGKPDWSTRRDLLPIALSTAEQM